MLALAFAGSTWERWLARHRRHELAWTVALLFFACGAASLWAGATLGWNEVSFRFFYAFGAVLNVPALALGTIYLLGGKRLGDRFAVGIALSLAFAAGVITVAPLTHTFDFDPAVLPQGSEVFGPLPRVLAAVASAAGALVVFGGALWSAARLRRSRPRLVAGNLVIALGTAMLSMSGMLNSLLGEMDAFAVTLTAGIAVLFAGFLISTSGGSAGGAASGEASRADGSGQHEQLQHSGKDDDRQQDGHGDGGSGSQDGSDREEVRSDTGTAAVVALFGEVASFGESASPAVPDESRASSMSASPTSRPSSSAAD